MPSAWNRKLASHRPARGQNSAPAAASGRRNDHAPWRWLAPVLAGSAAVVGATVLYNYKRTRDAEHRYPPIGQFLDVDGVRLHYLERGQGEPLVLIHGNGTMIQDFTVSGLVDRLASRYRVIVIDRPGYGYSTRPRELWTPHAHARLFRNALAQLGVERATVLGHSWGTLVAVALALEFPSLVRSLVLASGYYYPTLRADVFLLSPPAIPLLGDAMRYTISPPIARAMLPWHDQTYVRTGGGAGSFRSFVPEGTDGPPVAASCGRGGRSSHDPVGDETAAPLPRAGYAGDDHHGRRRSDC